MTFTVWERVEDALGFAYKNPPHREIVEEVREHGLLVESMFIRMRPYAASGTWPSTSRFGPRFARFAESPTARAPLG
jgi:hypothetical protein